MKQEKGDFSRKVIRLAKQIPPGKVTTYGLLAVAAGGHPILAQMITHILSKAPDQSSIPYHRIVYSNGKVWLSENLKKERLALYKKEGIKLDENDKVINFEEIICTFNN